MGRFSFTALIITAAALLCNLAAGEMYAQTEVLRPKVSATAGGRFVGRKPYYMRARAADLRTVRPHGNTHKAHAHR